MFRDVNKVNLSEMETVTDSSDFSVFLSGGM